MAPRGRRAGPDREGSGPGLALAAVAAVAAAAAAVSAGDAVTTAPRTYAGARLEAVAMPIGGIGTGTVWIDGHGRLAVWQVFNNQDESGLPDSFLALSVRQAGAEPTLRVLQTAPERGLPPFPALTFEGGYPIARLDFVDPALPVRVRLEAWNPMVPLDTASSSLPAALFRVTVANTSAAPVDAVVAGTLRNARGDRNRPVREDGMAAVVLGKAEDPVRSGPVILRSETGERVPGPGVTWLAETPGLTTGVARALVRVIDEGGILVLGDVQPAFFEELRRQQAVRGQGPPPITVFEDFEGEGYLGWTVQGEAFGTQPARGTLSGQQEVSGFAGRGLVNTFLGGDGPQGTATSKPFRIEKPYIGMLVGGGGHAGETCVNLLVEGRTVRTAQGRNLERLEPVVWEVSEWRGKEAVIEIVDRHSGGWGHINVDQIVFGEVSPEAALTLGTDLDRAVEALRLTPAASERAKAPPGDAGAIPSAEAPPALRSAAGPAWRPAEFTRLTGFQPVPDGFRVVAAAAGGDPLLLEGPLGKGRLVIALAPGLPWRWGAALITALRGPDARPGETAAPGYEGWGELCLAALDPRGQPLAHWGSEAELHAFLRDPETAAATAVPADSEALNAAVAVPVRLEPGESRTQTLAVTWRFPNVQRFGHWGNYYCRQWPDALAAARHLAARHADLWALTALYRDTVYASNLPEEFLDAMTSQSVILRGPTCFRSEDGYFGGFEGCYGCCPLNCTHVWNYAQTHARLFPEIARNMRVSDFVTYLHEDGETSHRQHGPHGAFIDGHCACIAGAYREHLMSPDRAFLESVWPGVRKAVDWMIGRFDADRDGVPSGQQWNTYDCAVSGENTFIGSQYLCALAAGEQMALAMGDADSAARWRAVREAGMRNQNERLWNGSYYIQKPGAPPAHDYNNGCHSDQLLGQWWAHQLGLGYLYPPERVRSALAAVVRYNVRPAFAGFVQRPRRYVPDDEGGLLMCTWPGNDRPDPFIIYADEVWTGIEYAAAGALVYESMVEPARQIVRTARGRYDGRLRPGLNSGPGGNPFNELECGKFYARAMSSWGLLLACQGLVLDGPRGVLGFRPRWQPAEHRSFFTAPEGWGLFSQECTGRLQTERIEVRHGCLRVRELVFELPVAGLQPRPTVTARGEPVAVEAATEGREVRLTAPSPITVPAGAELRVELAW